MRVLSTLAGTVRQLAYRADAQALAAVVGDWPRQYAFQWWDLERAKLSATIPLSGWPRHFTLAQNGEVLAYTEANNLVVIGTTEQNLDITDISGQAIEALALSADGSLLAMARPMSILSGRSEIRLTSTPMAKIAFRPLTCYSGDSVHLLRFSPDGQCLAMAGSNRVSIWSIKGGLELANWSPVYAQRFVFSPDGSILAVAAEGVIYLWDGREKPSWPPEAKKGGRIVQAMAYSPDGRFLATDQKADVCFWDPDAAQSVASWHFDIGTITALAFSPDGLTVAAGSESGRIVVWDVDGA